MSGWRRWAVASVTLVAGVVVLVPALRSPDVLQSVASVGSLIAALAPLVLGLVVWARRPPPVALATSTIEQINAAERQLASQVLRQWRDEINVRQLDDPGPLAVRWRFTKLDVVDHDTRGNAPRTLLGRGRHRFTGRSDRIGELAAEFRTLTRRRLVILGEPGMGKTTLALLLLRELLDHAEPGDPVPVLLSTAGWDPDVESLPDWLARRLAEDYPTLRATLFGPDAAWSLVTQRRILPVLDGLDELPDEVRPSILARLNETAADPLVLTCRTTEYRTAVTTPGGNALTGAAVIEPVPLTPADTAGYLTSCLPPGTGDAWRPLLRTLRSGAGSPVGSALSTPLALWLLRKVYVDTRTDPSGLCDAHRFPNADAVVEHLLDHLVDALISANPPRRGDNEHPFRPVRAWDPADTTRWLAFLAHHLATIGSRDLAWWQLRRAARGTVGAATGLVAGLVLALVVTVTEWLRQGLAEGLLFGPLLGLLFGLVVGFTRDLTVGHVLGLVFGLDLVAVGVGSALMGELVLSVVFAAVGATFIVLVAVLAVRAAEFTATEEPAYADIRLRGRAGLLVRKLAGWGEHDLALRFVPGFTAGFVFGGVLGFVFRGGPGLASTVLDGLVSALLFGLVAGLASWLATGAVAWAKTPLTGQRPQTPTVTFRRDLRLVYVNSLAGGCATGLAFGVQEILLGGSGLMTGLAYVVLGAVATGLGVGLHQSSGRYLVTVSTLHLRRQIPLRLLSFLDDAHRLGLLRQTGPVYQFRHAKLQDRLASKHCPSGRHRDACLDHRAVLAPQQ